MKTASKIVLTFCILVFFASVSFAQVASTAGPAKTTTKSSIDAPGKVDNTAKTAGAVNHGKNFVDKNGDGKCDNCGSAGTCKGTGTCAGKGQCGKGQGCGSGCGKSQGTGNGCGQGHQHRNGCATQGTSAPAGQPKK